MRLLKEGYRIRNGDSLDIIKELADNSVDSIVCDPPYGLSKEPDMLAVLSHWMAGDDYAHKGGGFMGKKWDSFVPGPAIWKECLRVLKPGGYLLSFFGSRTYDMGTLAIRLAGFEVRDQIMWVYGSGFPKSLNIEKATQNSEWAGWGTALKPAHEPICVARKPLEGTVAANVRAYGTGGLNIDGCRVGEEARYNAPAGNKPGGNSYNMSAIGMPEDATGSSVTGRWPANLVHDGSDEVLAAFPESKGQQGNVTDAQRSKKNVYGAPSDNGKSYVPRIDSGKSAARFFYCAKASKADRNIGLAGRVEVESADLVNRKQGSAGMNNPRAGAGRTSGSANTHPTVKPIDLMAWLVRMVTPKGGLVLDPFAGSGSTGVAALQENMKFIGIELSEEYAEIAKERLKQVANAHKLQ